MNNKFSLKFKKWDLLIVIISSIVSLTLLFSILIYNISLRKEERFVAIYHKNQLIKEKIDLNLLEESKTITLKEVDYPDLLGDFVIEISPKKGVRAYEVTCPNHTCTKQGWVNIPNLSIICIPNKVRIELTSTSSEGDIFLEVMDYEYGL